MSRKWLLVGTGCECIVASSLAEFRGRILEQPLDLIILCQTVSPDECLSASAFAAEHMPDAQLLIMFGRHHTCVPEREYVLLDAMGGPEAFIKTVERLLAKSATYAN